MKKLVLLLFVGIILLPTFVHAGRSIPEYTYEVRPGGSIPGHSHEDRMDAISWDTQFKPETSDKNNKINQLSRLSDNNPFTVFNYTQWNSERTDTIPELTAYTGRTSIGSIGLRNGDVNESNDYYDNARLKEFRIVVYCSSGVFEQSFDVPDYYCTDYQIFPLDRICHNVSQVDIYLCNCYQGSRNTWNVCISDLVFLDGNGNPGNRIPAPKPPVRQSGWNLRFLSINTDQDDYDNTVSSLFAGDTVYFHAKLTGGKPSEQILLHYEIMMNDELVESSAFNERFGNNSFVWVRTKPLRYGTLSVRIFYYERNSNGSEVELGHTSVRINPRDRNTQTETARGWISGCNLYFDHYGNFCIDLSDYAPSESSVIYFAKNDHQPNVRQGAISNGKMIWDTPTPGWVYEYAVWCGNPAYAQDVALLSQSQIPASAWIKISVTEDMQISIVSSHVPINILPNQ